MSDNFKWALTCFLMASAVIGETYYVSPSGSDTNNGLAVLSPWRTVVKVNATAFNPGDTVLFERGGEWRESLIPFSSGAAGLPITFSAYGDGPLPIFLGSELLTNGAFEWVSGATYQVAVPAEVTSVLVDQQFLFGGTPIVSIDTLAKLNEISDSWLWDAGILYINTGGPDPRTDGRTYSAVIRDDVIFINIVSNLVFRNLSVDESARYDAGYGVRIQNAKDILMEDCRAYRCGKHHFGLINTTGFIGRRLYGAYAMPGQGSNGASTYVAFSDALCCDTTSQWLDCSAEYMDDTYAGSSYRAFVAHGEGIGSILVSNMTSRGAGVSTGGSAMTLLGGSIYDAELALYSNNGFISGLHISGPNGHVDIAGNENLIENCLIEGGDIRASYKSLVTFYGVSNVLRYCTIIMDTNALNTSTCIALATENTQTRWYGNVLMAVERVFRLWGSSLTSPDISLADYNRYNSSAKFTDDTSSRSLSEWQSLGHDSHSTDGDPGFMHWASGDFHLSESSVCIDAASMNDFPGKDFDLVSRPLDGDLSGQPLADMGAFEFAHSGADTDGDGMSDADEVIADTDAVNEHSKLAFIDIRPSESGLQLDWIGGHSVKQVIEVSTKIDQSESWQAIYTNEPPTPIANSLFNTTPAANTFYRLKAGRQ